MKSIVLLAETRYFYGVKKLIIGKCQVFFNRCICPVICKYVSGGAPGVNKVN